MSNERIENASLKLSLLKALAPNHLQYTKDQLLDVLNSPISDNQATYFFDPVDLFDTDCYRAEILTNVDKILLKYEGDFITLRLENTESTQKIQKELLWAGLQLLAHLQTIEQEIGLQLERHNAYASSLKKLEVCRGLLVQTGYEPNSNPFNYESKLGNLGNAWYETKFKEFIQFIDDRNSTRLFWVWGRPNVGLALEWAGQTDAKQALLDDTEYWPGQVSWSLYLFRGTFYAAFMFNVWWNDPKWLEEKAGLSVQELASYRARHWRAYWDVYKYRILNDYVWGPINLLCCFWLKGDGFYGWLGDFATCFLLCMDIYLARLQLHEGQDKFEKIHQQHEHSLDKLSQKILTDDLILDLCKPNKDFDRFNEIDALVKFRNFDIKDRYALLDNYIDKKTPNPENPDLEALMLEWREIRAELQDLEQRWEKKKSLLKMDFAYAVGLLIIFICASALLIGLIGASLQPIGIIFCLVLTIAYRTSQAITKINHDIAERDEMIKQGTEYDYQLSLEHRKNKEPSKTAQLIYLNRVNNQAKIQEKSGLIQYQYYELIRTTLMRLLIPAAIGLTFVFAPATCFLVPTFVFVLVAAAVFAFILDQWAKAYKPDTAKMISKISETDYDKNFFKKTNDTADGRVCVNSQPVNQA